MIVGENHLHLLSELLCDIENGAGHQQVGGWMVGPTIRRSFNDIPVADFADASKTTRNFVVVLDSLRTACIGM